jgi:hypothetical protein
MLADLANFKAFSNERFIILEISSKLHAVPGQRQGTSKT